MRFSIKRLLELYENHPKYSDGFIFKWSGIEKNDFYNIRKILNELTNKNPDLNFYLVASYHQNTAERQRIKTKKRGQPRTVIHGEPAKPHLHGVLIQKYGDITKVRRNFQSKCRSYRGRHPNMKQQKTTPVWKDGLPIVYYSIKQASKTGKSKGFDFLYFASEEYAFAYSIFGEHGKDEQL